MDDSSSKNLPTASSQAPSSGFKVANVPKVTYLDPQSISNNYGWGLPVDFVFPKTIGKVMDMVLQIDIDCGENSTAVLPATPFWFERIETSIGGSAPFETVNKDEIYEETVQFLPNQDFLNIAQSVNYKSLIGNHGYDLSHYSSTKKGRYFLPLWANCMMTSQPYLKGFNSEWKLRFTLSNNQPTLWTEPPVSTTVDGVTTTTPVPAGRDTVKITGLRILVTEAQLPPNVESRLAYQHSKGVTYNTVNRVRHTDTKQINSPGDIEYTLTTFGNESAGVLLYIRAADNSSDYSALGLRAPVSYVNLRDAQGNPYYATNLDGTFNRVFLAPWSLNRESIETFEASQGGGLMQNGSNITEYLVNPTYLLPFSAHVGAVLEDGRDLGAYALSGKEKAVLSITERDLQGINNWLAYQNTENTPSNPVFVAVSYDYMRIKVKGGNARISYNR